MNPTCQCCGKEIKFGEQSIRIEYGILELTARAPINGKFIAYTRNTDFFHLGCDVAIRQKEQVLK